MKIRHKYFIVFLILAISTFYLVDVPLWHDLTGGNTKYWKEYRTYGGGIGYHETGLISKLQWDFKLLNGNIFKNDTVILSNKHKYSTFFGTINNYKKWSDRKVIYHSQDSIAFITKTEHRDSFDFQEGRIHYLRNGHRVIAFVNDTLYWKRMTSPTYVLDLSNNDGNHEMFLGE